MCQTYVNPFMTWTHGGDKFRCNICGYSTVCPSWYFSSLTEGQGGLRFDRSSRQELSKGSVDFVVPSELYSSRTVLQEPLFIFIIDASRHAVASGLKVLPHIFFRTSKSTCVGAMTASIQAVRSNLSSMKRLFGDRCRVGLVTFHSTSVFFYSYNPEPGCNHSVSILSVDPSDPICPLPPSSWILSLQDPISFDFIESLLWRFTEIAIETNVDLSSNKNCDRSSLCAMAAVQAASESIESSGGNIVLFSVHNFGPYAPGVTSSYSDPNTEFM